jgi:hypothetical protein
LTKYERESMTWIICHLQFNWHYPTSKTHASKKLNLTCFRKSTSRWYVLVWSVLLDDNYICTSISNYSWWGWRTHFFSLHLVHVWVCVRSRACLDERWNWKSQWVSTRICPIYWVKYICIIHDSSDSLLLHV